MDKAEEIEEIKKGLETMIESQRQVLAHDELFKLSAKIFRKSYWALCAEGFSGSEAVMIIASSQKGKV